MDPPLRSTAAWSYGYEIPQLIPADASLVQGIACSELLWLVLPALVGCDYGYFMVNQGILYCFLANRVVFSSRAD